MYVWPAMQPVHVRSDVRVGACDWRVPAAQPDTGVHDAAFSSMLKLKPRSQFRHTRLMNTVAGTDAYVPGAQVGCDLQAFSKWSFSSWYLSGLHVSQSVLEVKVAGANMYSPALHESTSLHEASPIWSCVRVRTSIERKQPVYKLGMPLEFQPC